MKVLVTGATGLIGSVLTQRLVADGCDVRILHRKNSPLKVLGDALGSVERVEGDLLDPGTVATAMQGVRQVHHVAAYIGYGSRREWRKLYEVNVRGTALVVDAALRENVERLVYTSSIAALGRPDRDDVTIDESQEWISSRANSYYARSKHLAELQVQRAVAEGLDAVLVNPSIVLGVGRPGENIGFVMERIRKGQMFVAPAGGSNFVDVVDVADAHIKAMNTGATGERYIIGGENLLWRTAFADLAHAFGKPGPRFIIPPDLAVIAGAIVEAASLVLPLGQVLTRETARMVSHVYRYDNTKAREELGCTFSSVKETGRRLAEELGKD